ncbi:uncharacterized protein B0H18DRAFT_1114371 [Fomitopsis serialis]|uniref:uncharacterized protein n=1 Tax=Fomitopsis serialis TaxID=139415 RepID=UPI002007B887|nr:uncharacterized protein B0H18DRAFT_1114371 [Neoantrodia serialis]KAH9935655.1 hypothetical protein B0H18DRAFT_1114371 [Neoantrodia serialis]
MSDALDFSEYNQKCSYCLKEVGKDNLRSCRCRYARYCSRQCQTNAWPTHKAACSTDKSLKYKLDQPGNKESKKLHDHFTKWLNYYRDTICTRAISAFNLPNSPTNKLATHCMYLVVEQQPEAKDIPFYFRMVSGQVISRRKMIDTFNNLKKGMTEEEVDSWARDNRGEHTLHVVIQFEDMIRFLWFSLRDLSSYRVIDSAKANRRAGMWANALASAIDDGRAGPDRDD